ncbi:MAG: hypothetical protein LCH53_09475 [Bacteroidetes bacterium]|nr:hypothetical protein [Bacteroidota bacterium]
MKRLNLHITEEQFDWLAQQSDATGLTGAEIVRRAIDAWIGAHNAKQQPLFPHIIPRDQRSDPVFKKRPYRAGEVPLDQEEVLELIVHVLRRIAPAHVMGEFDAEIAEMRTPPAPSTPS